MKIINLRFQRYSIKASRKTDHPLFRKYPVRVFKSISKEEAGMANVIHESMKILNFDQRILTNMVSVRISPMKTRLKRTIIVTARINLYLKAIINLTSGMNIKVDNP